MNSFYLTCECTVWLISPYSGFSPSSQLRKIVWKSLLPFDRLDPDTTTVVILLSLSTLHVPIKYSLRVVDLLPLSLVLYLSFGLLPVSLFSFYYTKRVIDSHPNFLFLLSFYYNSKTCTHRVCSLSLILPIRCWVGRRKISTLSSFFSRQSSFTVTGERLGFGRVSSLLKYTLISWMGTTVMLVRPPCWRTSQSLVG